jgi:Tfp pilus assembly protein PilN
MYSFTKARKKSFFQEDTKLWLIFLMAITFLFSAFSLFIWLQSYNYTKDIDFYKTEIKKFNKDIESIQTKKEFMIKQKALFSKIDLSNSMLKDSLNNLLDLIPDPITLTKIVVSKNSLQLFGITPTKEVYNTLLLPPLKSIFTTTQTNFYMMDNGWFKFYSKNELSNEN